MIATFDVNYVNDTATTACICFENWTDSISTSELIEEVNNIEPYESGNFYKRELPCLLSLIKSYQLNPDIIVIDGYVWLEEDKIGLGGHLFAALDEKIPVVGVAKTRFKIHSKVREVLRGDSQNPLYVTAIGVDIDEIAQNVKNMDGEFRLPTLLKRVDQLCRKII